MGLISSCAQSSQWQAALPSFKEEGVLGAWGGVSGPYLCGRELVSPELAAGVRDECSFAGGCTLHVLSKLETAAHQLTAEQ